MASGAIPKPGSEYGECLEKCEHIDCAANHAMAAVLCRICSQPIGYDVQFFDDTSIHNTGNFLEVMKPSKNSSDAKRRHAQRVLVHALCIHKGTNNA